MNGIGGTGKSHVIKIIWHDVIYFLQQRMNVDPDQPLVLLTTPTSLAAFNISGMILHSAFMLNSDNNSSEVIDWEKKSTMQMKLNNIALCVIDEVSMVGLSTFNHICSTMKKIKQSNDDWGGISVLAVGDLYQLPPVVQCPRYKKPHFIQEPGDLAPLLWHDFLTHDLDQVMRQKDIDFATSLNNIQKRVPERITGRFNFTIM